MTSEIRANTLKNRVGLGTVSFTNTGPVVSGIVTANGLELNSVDAGSSAGPEVKLFRNSASPANADYLGQLKFAGESSTGVERNYAKITGKILDVTNGSEDGILEFAHIKGGSQTITGRWRSDSLQLLNDTNLSVAGNTTLTGDIDVDGHTNLDNVSIAGVTTFSNNIKFDGATAGRDVTFIRSSNTLEFATNAILELGNGGSGDCRLFNNGTDTRIINGDGTLKFESDTHEFRDKDNTTSYLNITSTGRLGVGIAAPTKLLDIATSSSADGIRVKSTGNTYNEIAFDANRTSATNHIGRIVSRWNGTLVSYISLDTGTDTTNKDDGQIRFFTSESGGSNVERLRIDSNGRLSFAGDTDTYIWHPSANQLAITRGGGSFPIVRIGTGGNGGTIGIGTDSNLVTSGEIISVRGYSSFKSVNNLYAALYTHNEQQGSGNICAHILFNVGGANRGGFGYHTDNNSLIMANHTNIIFKTGATQLAGTERLRIDSGGDIFIGTSTDIAPTNGTNLCVSDATIARLILEKQSVIKYGINVSNKFSIYDETNDESRFEISSTGDNIKLGTGTRTLYYQRSLAAAINSTTEIVRFQRSNGAHSMRVSIVISSSGFSCSKVYEITSSYNQTSSEWRVVRPISSTGRYDANFELLYYTSNQITELKLRKVDFATYAGVADIAINYTGSTATTTTVTPKTGTGTDTNSYNELEEGFGLYDIGNGRTALLKPYYHPAFYAQHQNSGLATLTSGNVINHWNDSTTNKGYDRNGDFNSSTGVFTAPVSGTYLFTGTLLLYTGGSAGDIHVFWQRDNSNGNRLHYWGNTRVSHSTAAGYGGHYVAQGDSTTIYMNKGAQIWIGESHSGTLKLHTSDANWGHFSGVLLG